MEADKSFSLIPLAVDDIHHRVDVIFKNELIFPIKAIHFVCTVMSPMLGVPKGRKASNQALFLVEKVGYKAAWFDNFCEISTLVRDQSLLNF